MKQNSFLDNLGVIVIGVVLAAGFGSRLLPFTSFRPKHMLPVAGKPILHRSLEYMRDVLDISDITIVVGYQREAIMDYFKSGEDLGIKISYVIQHSDQARGLAAAVNLVKGKITSDFVLLLGDNLFSADLKKVIDNHNSSGAACTLHIEEHENPQRFGVVEIDGDNVISLEEKPKQPKSNNVITGFYVFSPVIFNMIPGLKPSFRGELELTDAIQALIDNNYKVKATKIDGWRYDIGFPKDLLSINQVFMNDETHSILGKVENSTIIPPVFIAKNCIVKGSIIGSYVMIENGVMVEDSEIKNSVILEKTTLRRSNISDSVIWTNSLIEGLKAHSLRVGDYSVISNDTL